MNTRHQMKIKRILFFLILFTTYSCGGEKPADEKSKGEKATTEAKTKAVANEPNIGIGPIKKIDLPAEIDADMAAKGKDIFELKCNSCHKPAEKFIGPAPQGILERRTPEWVMNMILNPEEMVLQDSIAKALLIEYNMAPMANQGITEEEARQLLEYFRTL